MDHDVRRGLVSMGAIIPGYHLKSYNIITDYFGFLEENRKGLDLESQSCNGN